MFGKYDHSVDDKGRIFVPAKFREELGNAFYVTIGLDRCLSVYTEAAWQKVVDKFESLPISQAAPMRLLFANAAKCEPDKQGRFLLPVELRTYAGLEKEVSFIGMGSRGELWNRETYVALEREQLTPDTLRRMLEDLNF